MVYKVWGEKKKKKRSEGERERAGGSGKWVELELCMVPSFFLFFFVFEICNNILYIRGREKAWFSRKLVVGVGIRGGCFSH